MPNLEHGGHEIESCNHDKHAFPTSHLTTHAEDMNLSTKPQGVRPFKTVAPGVDLSVLRSDELGSLTFLVRIAKGARAPHHDHPGGEETYVVSGKLRIGGRRLVAGDYHYTPPGEQHDGQADEDTLLFVVAPRGIVPTGL